MKLKIFSVILLGLLTITIDVMAQNVSQSEHMRYNAEVVRIISNLVGNMVYVEGGTFTMGATPEQGDEIYDDEKPAHQVTVSPFYIGKYEVTQAEWFAVMGVNPSDTIHAQFPVVCVSWDDCQEFIARLNAMTGKQFRLPTEAEWEFAARGGNKSKHYKYAGSNDIEQVAWYVDNYDSVMHYVGQKAPNELGLHDMSGGVYEWCNDWYGEYAPAMQNDPKGPATASLRVRRGGSWGSSAKHCRVSLRYYWNPDIRSNVIGLRLAL